MYLCDFLDFEFARLPRFERWQKILVNMTYKSDVFTGVELAKNKSESVKSMHVSKLGSNLIWLRNM